MAKYLVVYSHSRGMGNVHVVFNHGVTIEALRDVEADISKSLAYGSALITGLIPLEDEKPSASAKTDKEAFVELMTRFGIDVNETICSDPAKGSYFELEPESESAGKVRGDLDVSGPAFTFAADGSFDWIEV